MILAFISVEPYRKSEGDLLWAQCYICDVCHLFCVNLKRISSLTNIEYPHYNSTDMEYKMNTCGLGVQYQKSWETPAGSNRGG